MSLVYYGGAFLLHFVAPLLLPVQSVQVGSRRPGQVKKEALNSLGEERQKSHPQIPVLVQIRLHEGL